MRCFHELASLLGVLVGGDGGMVGGVVGRSGVEATAEGEADAALDGVAFDGGRAGVGRGGTDREVAALPPRLLEAVAGVGGASAWPHSCRAASASWRAAAFSASCSRSTAAISRSASCNAASASWSRKCRGKNSSSGESIESCANDRVETGANLVRWIQSLCFPQEPDCALQVAVR